MNPTAAPPLPDVEAGAIRLTMHYNQPGHTETEMILKAVDADRLMKFLAETGQTIPGLKDWLVLQLQPAFQFLNLRYPEPPSPAVEAAQKTLDLARANLLSVEQTAWFDVVQVDALDVVEKQQVNISGVI